MSSRQYLQAKVLNCVSIQATDTKAGRSKANTVARPRRKYLLRTVASSSRLNVKLRHLTPFDGLLAAEGEDVGATGASTLPGEQWGAVVLRSRADVAPAGANLGLGSGKTRCSEACKEEGVKGELHLDAGLGGPDS